MRSITLGISVSDLNRSDARLRVMRSIWMVCVVLVGVSAQAQSSPRPVIVSHDIVDGPVGGRHTVEDLSVFEDGDAIYTLQEGRSASSGRSYRAKIGADQLQSLVQLLNLSDIRALPQTMSALTRPSDFLWDKTLQINRPDGPQRVHIEDFYPFLNLNSSAYPWALIKLECNLQSIKTAVAKGHKNGADWCADVLEHDPSAVSSYSCNTSEAQTAIIGGAGWGSVRLGTKRKVVEASIGEGHPGEKFADVHFVEYRSRGIEISFNNSDETIHAIFFYNHQQDSSQFGVFCGHTDKGIGWNSTVDDVRKLYGQPTSNFIDGSTGRLVFPGVDFRFENGKLVRIGIPGL